MTKLEAVERKIRELVPRTMKLSFGCEVIWGSWKYIIAGGLKEDSGRYTLMLTNGGGQIKDNGAYIPMEYFNKIIGHPITLSDILEAMHAYSKTNRSCWVAINLKGGFMDYEGGGYEPEENGIQWHFGKPFSSQTELINWLYDFFNLSK